MNGLHWVTGRVTFDPEQRFTNTGKALVTFSIVVDQGHTVATEERAAPPPIYLRVTAWEPSEELLEQLRKGASVYVEASTSRCGLNVSAWRVDVHGAIGKGAPRPATRRTAAPKHVLLHGLKRLSRFLGNEQVEQLTLLCLIQPWSLETSHCTVSLARLRNLCRTARQMDGILRQRGASPVSPCMASTSLALWIVVPG
jgi:hypothetical protein